MTDNITTETHTCDMEFTYKTPYLNGVKHGEERVYYSSGRLYRVTTYVNGVKEGAERLWYANGVLETELNYKNDKKHGREVWNYENGTVKCMLEHNEGKVQRVAVRNPSGALLYEREYLSGKIRETLHRSDGTVETAEHERLKKQYENGELVKEVEFLDDASHLTRHYEKGRLLCELYFNNLSLRTAKLFLLNGESKTVNINNAQIPLKHLKHPEQIRIKEDIINEQNVTIRSLLVEIVGYEKFLKELDSRVVHSSGVYSLLIIAWHLGEEPIMLLKVRCHSTGVYYLLRVPPEMETCREALAWTFDLPETDYLPEEES